MSSSSSSWNFDQWQCGIGIVDSCRNQVMDWDNPDTWRALIDQIVPLTEVGLVFGLQYISGQIGPGVRKAANALRCMLNSGVSSTWYWGAATWLFAKHAGFAEDIRSLVDEGYLYVCTCIYDVNGLKEMLGQDAESNAEFASCSEKGRDQQVEARKAKEDYEAQQKTAAQEALVQAAKNQKIADTVADIKAMDGCNAISSSSAAARCFTALQEFMSRTLNVHKFWSNRVMASGGATSTTNREEQTNLGEFEWIREGAIQGARQLFSDRFDENGALTEQCFTSAGVETWGENAATCISDWVAAQPGVALCQGDACNAEGAVTCHPSNNTNLPAFSVADAATSCTLVELDYGYSQWQDKTVVTCTNPSTFQAATGFENCVWVPASGPNGEDAWQNRTVYVNADQHRFRTIGENVAVPPGEAGADTNKPGEILEEDIQCLDDDFYTVLKGSANCWPHWLDRLTIVDVGKALDGAIIKQDTYVWLSKSKVTCDDGTGVVLTGLPDRCEISFSQGNCSAKTLERQALLNDTGAQCIPFPLAFDLKTTTSTA